jgi:uncharacterized membrane protein YdbT with pleckstrin-like domain
VGYPEHLVQDGELVALDLRPHWWYFSRNILTAIPLLVVVLLWAGTTHGDVHEYVGYPVGAVALIWGLWLGVKYLEWRATYFVVTSRRVIYRTGVLAKRGVEIPLERINNINFSQSILDRLIGAGNLDIESAGRDGQSHFDFIQHPDGVQHEIYRQMEAHAQHASGADAIGEAVARAVRDQGTGPRGGDIASKIEQLARLRDEGHITTIEFEDRKNRLLDEL